jgi:1-acyl-sn-glycerol-3-phosphate acyltransferase
MELVELVHDPRVNLFSRLLLKLLRSYFRVRVEGLEHIPEYGPAIICPNHSGFAGADAVMLTHLISRHKGRKARILAHRAYFDFSSQLKEVVESFGMRRASFENGVRLLENDHLLLLFPEGEDGNFKGTYLRYRLQPFHTGFLRMAILARAPIIPCAVIGAEESHLNLGKLDLSRVIRGIKIPLPLNLIPLPAKWRIRFLPPIDVTQWAPEVAEDKVKLRRISRRIQLQLQKEIRSILRERKYVYFRQTRQILDAILQKAPKK